jgi:hypothetical protein
MSAAPTSPRFRILRWLGEGVMGVVYEALDRERGVRVALKKLKNFSPEGLARFRADFRTLEDLHHPNLVLLGELVSQGDDWFFTMELVDGCDFLRFVRGGAPSKRPRDEAAGENGAHRPSAVESGTHARADRTPGFDVHRLRDGLRQLAEGLVAVHDAGLVHRDVKPSNIRVTPDGRVVLLDFGLVGGAGERTSARIRYGDRAALESEGVNLDGHPFYMAPEQAVRRAIDPAADWYAFGVLLYQALTGVVPFRGNAAEVIESKQSDEPRPPRDMAANVPADLEALCLALLQRDPRARPTGAEVLRALGGEAFESGQGELTQPTRSSPGATFVGRAEELEVLRRAFRRARGGFTAAIVVRGPSGIGKSALARRFARQARRQEPGTIVLSGRCYERESVPYKAFEGVVEALAKELASRPETEMADLLPVDAPALVQVFPALRSLTGVEPLLRDAKHVVDPIELRSRAFGALRELLKRVAARAPVVVLIDDVQWADEDSQALAADLLRPPYAPSLLLVVTARSARDDVEGEGDFVTALPCEVRMIDLAGLATSDARDLAGRLAERAGQAGQPRAIDPAAIARESQGHPLLIDALVRQGASPRGAEGLEQALWRRIEPLDEDARLIVDLLSVSGAPVTQEVLARAAAPLDAQTLAKRVTTLRQAHLVKTGGARATDRVDVFHDRVRAAALAHVDASRRQALHRRLARAFEQGVSVDAEALSMHWLGAGDGDRASKYARIAGDRAARALAFERAAHFYEIALTLRQPSDVEARQLLAKLGEALANVGHAGRAAVAFQRAAEGAPSAMALDLRRRAAEQLLRGGHFDEGLAAVRALLASIGMQLPSSPLVGFFLLVVWRLFLRARGVGFRERDETQVAMDDLTRIDVCSSAALGLGLIDTMRAAALQSRHIMLALSAGEPTRVARALAFEGINAATGGRKTWRRTEALTSCAEAVAERTGRPDVIALATFSRGFVHYMNGKFRRAFELLDRAHRVMRGECAGMSFEMVSAQWAMLNCLVYLGELEELRARRPRYLREAAARGDLYGVVNLRLGPGSWAWLVDGKVDDARAEIADAMSRWSKQGFHVEHFNALFARVGVELYSGNGHEAYELVARQWPAMRRSFLLSIQVLRISARVVRAFAAVAAAAMRPGERASLLAVARSDARHLTRERVAWATAQASVVRAAAELLDGGDTARTRQALEEAVRTFEANEMALHAAAARRRLGRFVGGDEGRALVEAGTTWMLARGVRDPDRMTALVTPVPDPADLRWER